MRPSTLTRTWHGSVGDAHHASAQSIAGLICDRLARVAQAEDAIRVASTQSSHPMAWYGPSLAHGDAGLALMHAARAAVATDGGESASRAGAFLRLAVNDSAAVPLESIGVSAGTTGLLVALDACADVEKRWATARDAYVKKMVGHILATPSLEGPLPLSDNDYDLVNGRAGSLCYLVSRRDSACEPAIERLVDDLVWVSTRSAGEHKQWRWWSEFGSSVSLSLRPDSTAERFLNFSTSHGAAGLVGAMSAAALAGVDRPGLLGAIEDLVSYLRTHSSAFEHGPLWPIGLNLSEDLLPQPPGEPSRQIAWCYGAAGMALAFHTAADALDDEDLRQFSLGVIHGVWSRIADHTFFSPTLCHGTAGILLLALEFAYREPESGADEVARNLLDRLIEGADDDTLLIYQDREPPNHTVDQPSFLTGSAGVAATLLAVAAPRRPRWLAPFLFR